MSWKLSFEKFIKYPFVIVSITASEMMIQILDKKNGLGGYRKSNRSIIEENSLSKFLFNNCVNLKLYLVT